VGCLINRLSTNFGHTQTKSPWKGLKWRGSMLLASIVLSPQRD